MSAETEVAIVGGGIVGLAVAAALARRGRTVVLLERGVALAGETSARSSEVVHAGFYDPPGSLKAVLCVAGRRLVLERCRRLSLPHRVLGKLVVAAGPDELATLERLRANGDANGAPGLRILGAEDVRELEPNLRAAAALHSPESAIVDARALALSYAAEAEAHGAAIVLRTEVTALRRGAGGWRVDTRGPDGSATLECVAVVNAAGLAADRVAGLAGVDVDARGWRLRPCKGDYFALAPGAPASVRVGRLVYPVPAPVGLGVHATLDLGGRLRFGPDATYVTAPRYDVDPARAGVFADAVRRYLPAMRAEYLAPDFAGVRPRLAGPGEGFRDFVVALDETGPQAGMVQLVGIESPGLTAAPAIGERVAERLASL